MARKGRQTRMKLVELHSRRHESSFVGGPENKRRYKSDEEKNG